MYINTFGILSPNGNSIGCEPRLMKRRSQVRIPLPLPLHGHVQKKKKKRKKEEEEDDI
jgi:hypothetical protein